MKKALVLGGGGAKGAYELGVWQAVRELDLHFDLIVGASIGALTASLMVQDKYDECLTLWQTTTISELINGVPDLNFDFDKLVADRRKYLKLISNAVKDGGVDVSPTYNKLKDFTDETLIRNSPIDLCIVAVDVSDMSPVEILVKDIPCGQIVDYLMASSSCFPAFPMHKIGEHYYIDGGFYDNTPYTTAEKYQADYVISVHLKAPGRVKRLPRLVNHVLIEPYWSLGGFLHFDPTNAMRNARIGYLDTMLALHHYYGFAYAFDDDRSILNQITNALTRRILQINVQSNLVLNVLRLKLKTNDHNLMLRNQTKISDNDRVLRLIEKLMEQQKFDNLTLYNISDVLDKLNDIYCNPTVNDLQDWWQQLTDKPLEKITKANRQQFIDNLSQIIGTLTADQVVMLSKIAYEECLLGLLIDIIKRDFGSNIKNS